jgi:hypothetical protein
MKYGYARVSTDDQNPVWIPDDADQHSETMSIRITS